MIEDESKAPPYRVRSTAAPAGVGSSRSSSATRNHHATIIDGLTTPVAAWSPSATARSAQTGPRRHLIHDDAHRGSPVLLCMEELQHGSPSFAPACCLLSLPSTRGSTKQSATAAASAAASATGRRQLKAHPSRLIKFSSSGRFSQTRRTFVDEVGPGLRRRAGQ